MGALSAYEIIGPTPEDVLARVTSVAPIVDAATWPGAVWEALNRTQGRGRQIRVETKATFLVPQPGVYSFSVQAYAGQAELRVDGERNAATLANSGIQLDAGKHSLEISGRFVPVDPVLQLFWRGPHSPSAKELMPLYRLVEVDPACLSGASPPAPPA